MPAVSQLDPEQQQVVDAPLGPVCVLAGAGTGKTRAVTHRVAHLVTSGQVSPQHVLAVTFTTRAAGELRGRLRALGVSGQGGGVQAHTFHAAALRQLRHFWPRVVGGAMPELVDSKFGLVADAARRQRLTLGKTELRDLVAEVEWARARLVGPDDYAAAVVKDQREPPRPPEQVAAVYRGYEAAKQARGVLDFEDLLMLTAATLEEHADVADEVRARYRCFVVDEYQDVNPLQQRLLDAWLGDRDTVTVVGDVHQTIYSFTGASTSYLLGFRARFPAAVTVRLVRDYRSTPQVVGLANRLLAGAPRGVATPAPLELVAQRRPGPEPVLRDHDDEPAEAAAVAAAVRELVGSGTPASEVAILFRVNAQSEGYEQALAAAGVPYVLRGGQRFFDRPEVREAVVLLRGAARAGPDALADAGATLAEQVTEVLAATGWRPGEPPAGSGAARERWESLAALVRLAEDLTVAQPEPGLADLVAELEQRAALQHAPTVDGVTLASLHAAKGLEWDAVFLVGLADGTMPLVHAVTDEQVEEERRLLYVGVTRAREHLRLSYSRSRSPGGRGTRRVSRFLLGVVAGADPTPVTAGRSSRRTPAGPVACRVCGRPLSTPAARKLRRCEDCPADLDEALFEALRGWRRERAAEQSQPAFCVFTDATLTAIAEARPGSVAELTAIPGVGAAKLSRYGEQVLALVTAAAASAEG